MFYGSSKDLRKALKRMGIKIAEAPPATEVIIRTEDEEIVLRDVQVIAMEARGQKVWQIVAGSEERRKLVEGAEEAPAFSEEDVEFVMRETGASREEAIRALEESGGDIAEAILRLGGGEP